MPGVKGCTTAQQNYFLSSKTHKDQPCRAVGPSLTAPSTALSNPTRQNKAAFVGPTPLPLYLDETKALKRVNSICCCQLLSCQFAATSYLFLETQGLETMKDLYISPGDRQRQVLMSPARLAVLQLTDNDLLELLSPLGSLTGIVRIFLFSSFLPAILLFFPSNFQMTLLRF